MMKPIKLPTPIQRGETEIKDIQLRQPRAGELRGLETVALLRMDYNSHRTLIPRLCPVLTANDIDAMDPKTLLAIQQEVVGFFVE
ncbi:MAG: phage tail assembly protein [Aeromonas sobria]|uniref:phage tail assembly protein n=1 Tax=Aeromonas popoffii TaxID=70856 RepID=UPI003F2DC667